ncbi:MAG: hypothetical protein ABR962_06870 [Candidatus Bathyarchaeia archaeon]|jgi:hypothetical protein
MKRKVIVSFAVVSLFLVLWSPTIFSALVVSHGQLGSSAEQLKTKLSSLHLGSPSLKYPTKTQDVSNSVIQNGGFEQGLTGWTSAGDGFLAVSGNNSHSGNYSLEISSSISQQAYFYQYVNFPNASFAFSFWVFRVDPNSWTACYLDRDWDGNTARVVSSLVIQNDTIELNAWDNPYAPGRQVFNYDVTVGVWHNVTFLANATLGTQNFYVDGNLIENLKSSSGNVFNPDMLLFGDVSNGACNGTFYFDDITLNALGTANLPTPPSATITPFLAEVLGGQSQIFNSSVKGGSPPYTYQWYIGNAYANDSHPVSGAINPTYNFTAPLSPGTSWIISLLVTDSAGTQNWPYSWVNEPGWEPVFHEPVYFAVEPVPVAPLANVNASIYGLETPPTPSPAGENFTVEIHLRNATATNAPDGVAGVEVHFHFGNILDYCKPIGFTNELGQPASALVGPVLYGYNAGFYDDNFDLIATPPYTNATQYVVAAATNTGPWNGNDGLVAKITFQITGQPSQNMSQPDFYAPLQIGFGELVDSEGNDIGVSGAQGSLRIDGTDPLSAVTAEVRVASLNLNSTSRWGAGYIELPEGFNASEIDTSSLRRNGTVQVDPSAKVIYGDFGDDSAPEAMVEFNRTQLSHLIQSSGEAWGNVTLTMSGQLLSGTQFTGSCQTCVVSLVGDVNCDGTVSSQDLQLLAKAYNSHPGDPNWNDNADFASPWGIINLADLVKIAVTYGQHKQ